MQTASAATFLDARTPTAKRSRARALARSLLSLLQPKSPGHGGSVHNGLSTCGLFSRAAQSSLCTRSLCSQHHLPLHCIVVNSRLLLLDPGVIANHYPIDPAARIPTPSLSLQHPSSITCSRSSTVTARGRDHHQCDHHGEHLPPHLRLAPSPVLVRLSSCLAPAHAHAHAQPSMPDAPLLSVHSYQPQSGEATRHPNRTRHGC